MKTNPFYALSASAMLLGCWLLSEALHLQAGQLGGLLTLMLVLQLYEGLLVGLGAFLVRTGRAPRDGVTVLVLESVFLMDAPLLAAECVTADARMGTAIAVCVAALVAAKLAWVRRAVPGLLSARAAVLLGAQAGFVLAVPVLATHLASARVFGPIALYGLWWASLALPLAQRVLRGETGLGAAPEAPRAHAIWTWVPAAMTLLHLWAVGYIHALDFQPAFLAPLLLGLAATAGREQLSRQVALPGLALLVSLGQGPSLGFHLLGSGGPFISPLRLALLGVATAWGYLAWRDRERWLAVLALGGGAAGLLGASVSNLSSLLGRALRFLDSLLPRDAFGWGLLTVIAAFVLLAAGVRRSLGGEPGQPFQGPEMALQSLPAARWRRPRGERRRRTASRRAGHSRERARLPAGDGAAQRVRAAPRPLGERRDRGHPHRHLGPGRLPGRERWVLRLPPGLPAEPRGLHPRLPGRRPSVPRRQPDIARAQERLPTLLRSRPRRGRRSGGRLPQPHRVLCLRRRADGPRLLGCPRLLRRLERGRLLHD